MQEMTATFLRKRTTLNQLVLFIFIHVLLVTSTVKADDDDDSDDDDSSSDVTSTTSTSTTTTTNAAVSPSSDSSEPEEMEDSKPSTTATVDDPTTTEYAPTNDELCACFDFQLICNPFVDGDEICYYYKVKAQSTESYCKQQINSIVLGRGASEQCAVTYGNGSDIDTLLSSYSPQCYSLSLSEQGLAINLDADNNLFNVGSLSSSLSMSSGSSSVLDGTEEIHSESQSEESSSDSTGDVHVAAINIPDFIIFSVCFDANSNVDGVQSEGEVFFILDGETVTCPQDNAVPEFCSQTTTAEPTTAAPTTAEPTTTAPTTAEPTTANPTTVAPTTANPTTVAPTTSIPTAPPTTAEPTVAPTFDQCMSNDSLNIAFLLDESGSVSEPEWNDLIEFVDRIIQFDVSPSSYVSLFEFASLAAYTQFLDWTEVGVDRTEFTTALQNNPYNPSGQTYTWDAVSRVLDEFWDYKFTCIDGCQYRADMLFILTDGAPSDIVCPDIIERVNQTDIDIVIIGIGDSVADWSDQIDCLDAQDNRQDVYTVPEFDSEAFNAIEASIRAKTCSGLNTGIPDSRPADGTQWRYNGTIGLGPVPTRDGPGGGGSHDPFRANEDQDGMTSDELAKNNGVGNTMNWGLIGAIVAAVLLLAVVGIKAVVSRKRKQSSIDQEDMTQNMEHEADSNGDHDGNDITIVTEGLQIAQELRIKEF